MNKESLYNLFVKSKQACEIAGQDVEVSSLSFEEQYQIIASEVQEIHDAIADGDYYEVADGAVDTLVTVFGLIVKLEELGWDINKACDDIADNNLTKFPKDEEIAKQTVAMYAEKGVKCTYSYSEKYGVYVIRDEAGKYRKPVGFKSVDQKPWAPTIH